MPVSEYKLKPGCQYKTDIPVYNDKVILIFCIYPNRPD